MFGQLENQQGEGVQYTPANLVVYNSNYLEN